MPDARTARSRGPGAVTQLADKTCFVIMPYGHKADQNGKVIDFDEVYDHLIEPAVTGVGISDCWRSDKKERPGSIHDEMLNDIYTADLAIVDISALNPNVFYELGVRHALVGGVTVLVKEAGTVIPFNIQGARVIEYKATASGFAAARPRIEEFIRNGFGSTRPDSPVHKAVPLRIGREPRRLEETTRIEYKLRDAPDRRVGLVTGELRKVHGIDIWVNSENTYMQMARHFDPSVSGVIRYRGARRSEDGTVTDDLIADELAQCVGKNPNVPPGIVVATGSGELERQNEVRFVFHAAAVTGQVGSGYHPIPDIAECVHNALELAEEDRFAAANPTSILFPLLGTGTGRADVEETAPRLIRAAIGHLSRHRNARITRVYFLVRDERQLTVCRGVLDEAKEVVRARTGSRPPAIMPP